MKRIFKKYKDVCFILVGIFLFLLFYVYVQSAWVSGPYPEITARERAYHQKKIEEYQREQQRLKDME